MQFALLFCLFNKESEKETASKSQALEETVKDCVASEPQNAVVSAGMFKIN